MKRKIAVVTGTRAEYGLLYWTMKRINESEKLKLQLIVTGAHLSEDFGNTYRQIEEDGFSIDRKIDISVSGNTPFDISQSMSLAVKGFGEAYGGLDPDLLLVLGDRYEIFSAVSAAVPFNIPIAHISGGEETRGAIDNQFRHAITKLSHVHFPSTQEYAVTINMMGEDKERIFCVGALGIEWVNKTEPIPQEELEKQLDISFKEGVILATFHPVTLELNKTEEYIDNLLKAVLKTKKQVIFTAANADASGMTINNKIKNIAKNNKAIKFFDSLGQIRYLSCQKYCELMIGNSSSGITEAASFFLPVVNIGSRQSGRLQNENVINVGYSTEEIVRGIKMAQDSIFKERIKKIKNLYGEGNASEKIVKIFEEIDFTKLLYKKLPYKER